jgi:hypothetical protein
MWPFILFGFLSLLNFFKLGHQISRLTCPLTAGFGSPAAMERSGIAVRWSALLGGNKFMSALLNGPHVNPQMPAKYVFKW